MEYSEGSSNSSNHYANLLATVSQLRSDLERTVVKMNSLDDQNQSLQVNYQRVKEELIDTRKKYIEARENYMRTAAEKLETQRKSETFIENIKYQLSEKTKEFEQHRDKYTPQDIEYIRIQVQEELEVNHKQKIQFLESEIEKQKEQFFTSRRELERNKMEFETVSQNQKREMVSQRDDMDATIHSLRRQISDLQLKEYQPEKDEKLRAQRVRTHEVEVLLKAVQDELSELRKERDTSLHNAEVSRSRHEESYLELRGKLTLSDADKQALESRLASSQNSLISAEAQLRSKRQNADDVERQLRQTKILLEERELTYKSLLQSAADDTEKLQVSFDVDREEMKSTIELLESRLLEREEVARRLQRDMTEVQLRTEGMMAEQRKTYHNQLLEARQRIDSLELNALESIEAKKLHDSQHAQALDQYQTETGGLRSDVTRLQREKEILHGQLRSVEQKYASEKQRGVESKRAAEEIQRTLKIRMKTLEAERNAVAKKLLHSQHQVEDMQENLEKLKVSHEKSLDSMQREDEQRYEELGKTYRHKLEDMKSKVKKAVHRERKRGDAYKDHALIAQRWEKALTGAALAAASSSSSSGRDVLAEQVSTAPF
jgi:chromosome segregation ATPase